MWGVTAGSPSLNWLNSVDNYSLGYTTVEGRGESATSLGGFHASGCSASQSMTTPTRCVQWTSQDVGNGCCHQQVSDFNKERK